MSGWGGRKARRLTALTLSHYGDVCHLCGRRGATTADHVIPRALGGEDVLENLRPAHSSCNSSRGKLTMDQWRMKFTAAKPRTQPSRAW